MDFTQVLLALENEQQPIMPYLCHKALRKAGQVIFYSTFCVDILSAKRSSVTQCNLTQSFHELFHISIILENGFYILHVMQSFTCRVSLKTSVQQQTDSDYMYTYRNHFLQFCFYVCGPKRESCIKFDSRIETRASKYENMESYIRFSQ